MGRSSKVESRSCFWGCFACCFMRVLFAYACASVWNEQCLQSQTCVDAAADGGARFSHKTGHAGAARKPPIAGPAGIPDWLCARPHCICKCQPLARLSPWQSADATRGRPIYHFYWHDFGGVSSGTHPKAEALQEFVKKMQDTIAETAKMIYTLDSRVNITEPTIEATDTVTLKRQPAEFSHGLRIEVMRSAASQSIRKAVLLSLSRALSLERFMKN